MKYFGMNQPADFSTTALIQDKILTHFHMIILNYYVSTSDCKVYMC